MATPPFRRKPDHSLLSTNAGGQGRFLRSKSDATFSHVSSSLTWIT
jgi:hypothetical protein